MAKKVLIVDDEQDLVTLFSDVLESAGFVTEPAYDGSEVMALVKKDKPDLVLLDIKMPRVDGFEVLKSLRADPETKDVKIIMLSNMQGQEYVDNATSLGADDYWYKMNTHLLDLVEKVKSLLV